LSSQIEGTQSSLSDLLLFESDQLPGVPLDEVREVSRYTAAMEHGLGRLRSGSLPLSLRLVREIHGILLQDGRGSDKTPGEFRRSQNWIGGTRPGDAHYVPPPPEEIVPCMGDLETFLHDRPQRTSPLIKAALAHAQFETIHPFLDGNGRVGRLLVTLLLCSEGVLAEPILYLSLYLKRNRQEYYDRLQRVRTHGDWEGWLRFFLAGVVQTAEQAVEAARRSLALFEKDRMLARGLGRAAGSALQVHEYMQRNPIVAIPKAADDLGLSPPTITASLHRLGELGIVREITGKQTWRLFAYSDFLSLLTEGTEPIR
ncbi:MAG TPA: Fic family protein, partial [Thermoanaerobaculia bacterium]|nr:Fic family protein [Thermoanaerobaculia bacterium]